MKKRMPGRGGAHHTPKPHVDVGLLQAHLAAHASDLCNMGVYEALSKSQSWDPKAIVQKASLVKGILRLEPSGEVASISLRRAILAVLKDDNKLNKTQFNGWTWANLRAERVDTMLSHLRRARRDQSMSLTKLIGALNSEQYCEMEEMMSMLVLKDESLGKGTTKESKGGAYTETVAYEEDGTPSKKGKKRKLAVQVSDVTVDSEGLPKMLASPSPLKKGRASSSSHEVPPASPPPRTLRRRLGHKCSPHKPLAKDGEKKPQEMEDAESEELRHALGYEPPKAKAKAKGKAKAKAKAKAKVEAKATAKAKAKAKGKATSRSSDRVPRHNPFEKRRPGPNSDSQRPRSQRELISLEAKPKMGLSG